MVIYPAIDILNGGIVRLKKGDFNEVTNYGDDVASTAKNFAVLGAKWLHVVDLDGAKDGRSRNLATIKKIIAAIDIPIEVGGGIRTLEDVEMMLSIGVSRVIIGSAAVKNPALVKEACAKYGEKIAVGIDAKDGKAAIQGWLDTSGDDAEALVAKMASFGVKTIIYTDISRDGLLTGVNLEATKKIAAAARRENPATEVTASGGVASINDIIAVKDAEMFGVTGVITGKAIYDGRLDLKEALALQ